VVSGATKYCRILPCRDQSSRPALASKLPSSPRRLGPLSPTSHERRGSTRRDSQTCRRPPSENSPPEVGRREPGVLSPNSFCIRLRLEPQIIDPADQRPDDCQGLRTRPESCQSPTTWRLSPRCAWRVQSRVHYRALPKSFYRFVIAWPFLAYMSEIRSAASSHFLSEDLFCLCTWERC